MFESTTAGATLRYAGAQALTGTGISAEIAPGQWFSTYAEPAGVVDLITVICIPACASGCCCARLIPRLSAPQDHCSSAALRLPITPSWVRMTEPSG
jgi:hypothetical protein